LRFSQKSPIWPSLLNPWFRFVPHEPFSLLKPIFLILDIRLIGKTSSAGTGRQEMKSFISFSTSSFLLIGRIELL
jgi:hypothetical protein